MDYSEAVDILYTRLPMFQRSGPSAYKVNLDGTKKVCKMIGNPENGLKFVHVAGTNGKGTVCHLLASILQKAGYKVGLFTSPHLKDFRERIRVNGQMISEDAVADFVKEFEGVWEDPSFFELTFGLALKHFEEEQVDIVILETGMGGRLDSTNVIPSAELCVITNIGLDHQAFLGTDIRTIAEEKAGIIKFDVPVVLGKMRPEAKSVILEQAMWKGAEMYYSETSPLNLEYDSIPFFQENVNTAYAAIVGMQRCGWKIDDVAITAGILNFKSVSGQMGRLDVLPATDGLSDVIVDCAHNIDGMTGLMEYLSGQGKKLHIVYGTVSDKDVTPVLSLIPSDSVMYWCRADVQRSMGVEDLRDVGAGLGLLGQCYSSVSEALLAARTACSGYDSLQAVVCGSVYVVGEVV